MCLCRWRLGGACNGRGRVFRSGVCNRVSSQRPRVRCLLSRRDAGERPAAGPDPIRWRFETTLRRGAGVSEIQCRSGRLPSSYPDAGEIHLHQKCLTKPLQVDLSASSSYSAHHHGSLQLNVPFHFYTFIFSSRCIFS